MTAPDVKRSNRPPRPADRPGKQKRWGAPAKPRLAAIRGFGHEIEAEHGWMGPLPGPSVDPRLVTTYCPSAMRRQEASALAMLEARDLPDWKRPEGPEGPEVLGLSPGCNSDSPAEPSRRNGRHGLTANGGRSIRQATSVLEESRERLAFWTVTVPDEGMEELQRQDAWDEFQNAIRHRLARKLKARGLPALVVAVAELHPQRTRATGRPCPHLHVVFVGRRTRWNCWEIERAELDTIIRQALFSATGLSLSMPAAGNVQPVRWSVSRYLGQYLSKGGQGLEVCADQCNGLPRQWWFWTREMRGEVRRHTIALPYRFVRWVHGHRDVLELLGVISAGEVEGKDGMAPPIFWIRWKEAEGPAETLRRWIEAGRPAAP